MSAWHENQQQTRPTEHNSAVINAQLSVKPTYASSAVTYVTTIGLGLLFATFVYTLRACKVFVVKYPPISPQLPCHHKSQTHWIQSWPKVLSSLLFSAILQPEQRICSRFCFFLIRGSFGNDAGFCLCLLCTSAFSVSLVLLRCRSSVSYALCYSWTLLHLYSIQWQESH